MKVIRTYDGELIARLNGSVHNLHYELYPNYFKPYDFESMKQFFIEIINDSKFLFLIVQENNESLGYAWIEFRTYPETVFTKSYQSTYVHQICVNSSCMSKGYGSRLMEVVYETAQKRSDGLVELDYWSKNQNAKNFYNKQGFTSNREYVIKKL
ncbi:GNAT family N-acetyltransferase [Bacillus sp. AK128]